MFKTLQQFFLLWPVILLLGCTVITSEHSGEEMAQQIGDVMVSIDEFSAGTGALTAVTDPFAPKCFDYGFTGCTLGRIARTLGDCIVRDTICTGGVTLTWSNATTCSMNAPLESVTRVPDIRATGRRDATLQVSKSGSYGQRLIWVAGAGADKVFIFESDGINRSFRAASEMLLFDHVTFTMAPLFVSGTTRTTRIISGGTWTGSCSDENPASMVITGCGTAKY